MRDIEGTSGTSRRLTGSNKKINRSGSESTMAHQQRSRNCSESERSCPATPEPTALLDIDGASKANGSPANGSSAAVQDDWDMADVETETRLCNSLINLPTFLRHGDKIPHEVLMTITNNPRLYSIVLDNYPALFDGYVVNDETKEDGGNVAAAELLEGRPNEDDDGTARWHQAVKDPAISPLEQAAASMMLIRQIPPHHQHHQHHYLKGLKVKKRSLTYRGAMLNLPRYRLRASSCPDIYRNSITTIAQEKEGVSAADVIFC